MEEATWRPDEYEHSSPGVVYVVSNIPGPGVDIDDFESEYSLGCSCRGACVNCSCTRGSPNYVDGRIVEDELAGPIIECNSHCACRRNCGNRLVQNGPVDSLVVREVVNKGLGLLTTKLIRKGRFICEYAGEVISLTEARRRVESNKRENGMNYVLVANEHVGDRIIVTCIDPKYFGNIGRYANHSCQANASLVPIRVDGVVPRLCLFASRDIKTGEEVTFNYASGVINSIHDLSDTPCLCGSNNCSGYLPHDPI